MRTPRIFLCYAPRAGLRCAVAYLATERDAYGWFTGQSDRGHESAYFVLEDFYTPRETRYVAVPEADLHSRWTRDEAMCHELARLQEAFTREWLFYRSDPRAKSELESYAQAELASGGGANIWFERLNRLSKLQANWTYYSHDCEHAVLKYLGERWPLDYRVEEE
ncbi:MAG TPA: hypothetical protein VEG27_07340 [Usitatibacter sp.]|nr:hypothetical protein [Usitatibacter sp.]